MTQEKRYEGVRNEGVAVVYVNGQRLSPASSQKLINHSPDGFEWGYGGSGPSQLALAILLDFTGEPGVARRYYHDFRDQFIAPLRENTWSIGSAQIEHFLASAMAQAKK